MGSPRNPLTMELVHLLFTSCLLWLNLVGIGLIANRFIRDYDVARVGGPMLFCLAVFCAEHFYGFGSRLIFLPFSSLLSGWIFWRERREVQRHLGLELAFGLGYLYCLFWRYTFPDINLLGEKIPDLSFISDYLVGDRLPPVDRWLPPHRLDFYYSLQHYSAALLGRWFRLDAGFSYHYAYCVLVGLIAAGIYGAGRRFCTWRPAPWLLLFALLLGGCGLGVLAHTTVNHHLDPGAMYRFLGVQFPADERTEIGRWFDARLYPASQVPAELPLWPLSLAVVMGEYHPPLSSYLLLAWTALLLAGLETGVEPKARQRLAGLLGATVPLALLVNSWIFPLQVMLVVGWFFYRGLCGERSLWLAGLVGMGGAALLAFPFMAVFMQQPLLQSVKIELTPWLNHSWLGWLMVFWPMLGIALLGLWNREHRRLMWLLGALWVLLACWAEVFYVHDVNPGTWIRFNSTLKWWAWIYMGGVLTMGAANLAAKSRLCRYGTLLLILIPSLDGFEYARYYFDTSKPSLGHLEGMFWLTHDLAVRDLMAALRNRPDGICMESEVAWGNTESGVLEVFANKQALIGWPTHEQIWRNQNEEVRCRIREVNDFFHGRLRDPLLWLRDNQVRYILWLQRDNADHNSRFRPLWGSIRRDYAWHPVFGDSDDWTIGYFELRGTSVNP